MVPRIFYFLSFLFIFAVTFASTEEAAALLKWKATFLNQNSNSLLASWTPSTDACRGWYGVQCFNSRVKMVNIANASVIGTLHDFPFSSLSFLEHVDLSMNHLSGTILPELGKLTNLVYLNLSINTISGNIPPQIGKMNSLEVLALQSNNLTGPIPITLGDLTELKSLHLYSNQLSGVIPSELGNLKNLNDL
ncbi:hypothetical protein BC332_11449, partial [Capsicum chinense]